MVGADHIDATAWSPGCARKAVESLGAASKPPNLVQAPSFRRGKVGQTLREDFLNSRSHKTPLKLYNWLALNLIALAKSRLHIHTVAVTQLGGWSSDSCHFHIPACPQGLDNHKDLRHRDHNRDHNRAVSKITTSLAPLEYCLRAVF